MEDTESVIRVFDDADQLFEKRVRSRFSHRKLLFLPPPVNDLQRLVEHILLLPTDLGLPNDYVTGFNAKLCNIVADEKFKKVIDTLCYSDSTVGHLLRFLLVEHILLLPTDLGLPNDYVTGFNAKLCNIVADEKFKKVIDTLCYSDSTVGPLLRFLIQEHTRYIPNIRLLCSECMLTGGFEHLLERSLVAFEDNSGHGQSAEFRPAKLLISWHELQQGLKSNRCCPAVLMDSEC
ncbi:origin recognition complex subunit 4 [Castilleja foliolosa]|uniref:Origin recognition complex subunit 4 n=1 Tax=Castilleja foliolosa TaxID=1961234 RepID=A0ABD3CZJ1_9LAMI